MVKILLSFTLLHVFVLFVLQRGKQRPSIFGMVLVCSLWLFVLISLFVALGGKLTWLMFLQFFSYVKLAVTLIKYVPQVRMVLEWFYGLVCYFDCV